MSTASLPSYYLVPLLPQTPAYTQEPLENERRLALSDRLRPRPSGTFVKQSKGGDLKLRVNEQDGPVPAYGSGGIIDGAIDIAKTEGISSVEIKVEGRLKVKEIAEGGTADRKVCLAAEQLWSKESRTPCPSPCAFQLSLPTSLILEGGSYTLPPTYNVKLSGLPGFTAFVEYSITAVISKSTLPSKALAAPLSKASFLGINVGAMTLSTPFVYYPRTRPAVPLPVPLQLGRDGFDLGPEWQIYESTIPSRRTSLQEIKTRLYVPASRIFCASDRIPFHLTFESSALSLASFLPLGPSGNSTKRPTQLQIMRQVTVDVRNEFVLGTKTDIWRVDDITHEATFKHAGDGATWMSFTGEITINPSIKVMGFKVGGLTVKDCILFSMTPPDVQKSPFSELRQTPLRIIVQILSFLYLRRRKASRLVGGMSIAVKSSPYHERKSFKRARSSMDTTDESRKGILPSPSNGNMLNGTHKNPAQTRRLKKLQKSLDGYSGSNGIEDGDRRVSASPASTKHSLLQEQRSKLPIALGREALVQEFRENDVTVLLGETGSGKTTQVPQYLLESGLARNGMIAVTQPRKVAATSLAARVAAEQNVPLGSSIGYSVRFDERCSSETRIKYMTDGMIVRELMSDPLLSKYSVVIVDEAHERSLRTDLLIANLKNIFQQRNGISDVKGKGKGRADGSNPLKIIIMSATIDAEKFSQFFSGARILYVKGRQHPVKIYHSSHGQVDYVDAAMRTFFQIHTDSPAGDVLIFLPGQEDIESLEKSIQLYANQLPQDRMSVLICPMYASQASGQNSKVFNPTPFNVRKCILATNIAETSITIPGVKYVIDTGKCKEKRFLARNTGGGFDTLLTKDITQSSAIQRAGRAGREGAGHCFRLYTEESFKMMTLSAEPEIMRCSLAASLLQLKCIGQDLESLELMDQPAEESMKSSLIVLFLLGALDRSKEITDVGREMAAFPLEPVYSRAVIASKEYGCTYQVLDIVSVLSASSKLFVESSEQRDAVSEARKKFRHSSGDHITILNVIMAYRDIAKSENKNGRREWCRRHFLNERALLEATDIREQLMQTCRRLGINDQASCGDMDEPVIHSLGHGLAMNIALLQPDGSYKQSFGQSILKIHPSSTLCDKKSPVIIYDELVYTNQIYARGVSRISKSFLVNFGALRQHS
ncbi:hypothetical protein D9757_007043 [Collybiopsis confluens]|uniref:RNA helicase n=1 Tax=Collybiopsis confluens TaxID=2823264 RepID=A0A8H5HCB8_9AGAR|nr:hypothetical protein D9757_007043 [Collybiopsis confluens]